MRKLSDLPNYQAFRRPRLRVIKGLNNLYVVVSISRQAVERERVAMVKTAPLKIPFEIPVIDGRVLPVTKRRSKVNKLLKRAVDRDLVSQALVSAVALTEGYVGSTLAEVLRLYPKKLLLGIRGGPSGKKVDVSRVLSATSLDELTTGIIHDRVRGVLYAAPTEYFDYLAEVFSFELSEDTKAQFVEIKATRDLIVHADGRINETYGVKAGREGRGKMGQEIPLDEEYFTRSIRTLKTLVVDIYRGCLDKHGGA